MCFGDRICKGARSILPDAGYRRSGPECGEGGAHVRDRPWGRVLAVRDMHVDTAPLKVLRVVGDNGRTLDSGGPPPKMQFLVMDWALLLS